MAALAILPVLFVMLAASAERRDALKSVLEITFGPVVGLVGAATGFYFGAKSRD